MKITNKKRSDRKKRADKLVRYFQDYAAQEYKKENPPQEHTVKEKTTGDKAFSVLGNVFFWVIVVVLVGISL